MKLNSLDKLYNTLKYEWPEIKVNKNIVDKALKPIEKMLQISEKLK